jgi:hypothetical protein
MGSLWGSLVSAAQPGDELIAYFGGHGSPEGLAGINHSRTAPDLFRNAQVSGVVSSATGKGAHIRFILDSCYSGSAVQTVREEHANELAESASSFGDKVRAAAMAGVSEIRKKLITLRTHGPSASQSRAASHAGPQGQTGARNVTAGGSRDTDMEDWDRQVQEMVDGAAARIWAEAAPLLDLVKKAIRHPLPPPPPPAYGNCDAQLKYVDDLWNAIAQWQAPPATKPSAKSSPR